jgi:predicted RNA-binding Zn ribbon-like protein
VAADVPEPLRLTESFLNSVDVESAQDDLDSLPRFKRWLAAHGRENAARRATAADLALARELRDELRDQLLAHHDGTFIDAGRLDALAAAIGLAARFDASGAVRLAPAEPGVRGVLGEVLAAVVRAAYDGSWERLKICSSDACRCVYYDRSRNGSRRWCSMEVCGNRQKTRVYRSRHRPDPTGGTG